MSTSRFTHGEPKESIVWEYELIEDEECVDPFDGLSEPQVQDDNGDCFLLIDECIDLFILLFLMKQSTSCMRRNCKNKKKKNTSEEASLPKSTTMGGVQRSITDFYRSTKTSATQSTDIGGSSRAFSSSSEKKRQALSSSSSSFSKSVRRRFLFGYIILVSE